MKILMGTNKAFSEIGNSHYQNKTKFSTLQLKLFLQVNYLMSTFNDLTDSLIRKNKNTLKHHPLFRGSRVQPRMQSYHIVFLRRIVLSDRCYR